MLVDEVQPQGRPLGVIGDGKFQPHQSARAIDAARLPGTLSGDDDRAVERTDFT